MKKHYYKLGAILAHLSLFLFQGCHMSEQPSPVTELRFHLPKFELTLDPHKMEDAFSMAVVGQLYRGLLRFDPKGEVIPDLAVSWKESPDHLRFIFELKDAKFSDGTPITGKNVQMSFARMFHLGASMGADLDYIAGAREFRKTKNIADLGIRALSERKVEFELSHPSALFLKQIAVIDCAILPIVNFETALVNIAFSGPYRVLHSANDSQPLVLEKWRSDVLDSPNPPKKIVYQASDQSPETLGSKNLTDCLDHDTISGKMQNELISKGWKLSPTELVGQTYIILNPKVLSSKTRSALAKRVDRTTLLKQLDSSRYSAAFGIIPAGVPGELAVSDKAPLRLTAENELPEPGVLEIEIEENNPVQLKVASYLKSVWTTPQFSVNLKMLTKKEKMKRQFGKLCSACIGQKSMDYPDGYSILGYFRGGYEANFFHVQDAGVDHDLSRLVTYFNKEEREKKYRELQLKILEHHTFIPLLFGSEASGLWSPRVKRIPPHPMGFHAMALETLEMED